MRRKNKSGATIDMAIDAGDKKRRKLFSETPIWKAVLINSFPMIITMMVIGIYSFVDSILAIKLAPDSYDSTFSAQITGTQSYIRLAMGSGAPIVMVIYAVALLFSVGNSIRVSINLGAGRKDRAFGTLKTSFQISMITSLVLIPVLMFAAKPWMHMQYPASKFGSVVDDGYKYVQIIIWSLPFQMFGSVISSMFRVDGRLKTMMIANIMPIFINLFFDWVFMGPVGMGVEGGAWATFISYGLTALFLFSFILFKPSDLLNIKNMFGKFKMIAIVGVLLVGVTPFLRNFASSITQTTSFNIIQNISSSIFEGEASHKVQGAISDYLSGHHGSHSEAFRMINGLYLQSGAGSISGDFSQWYAPVKTWLNTNQQLAAHVLTTMQAGSQMSVYASGAFPILSLFFPILFGIVQGSSPLASFNYGAKKLDRVKKIFVWATLYNFILGLIFYFLGAFIITEQLLHALGVYGEAADKATTILRIILVGIPLFSFAISGMVIINSTDRILLSILTSTLRGFIFFFPIYYGFQAIALANTGTWWIFWLAMPIINLLTSLTILGLTLLVLRHLDKKHVTLDERLTTVYAYFNSLKAKRREKRKK